MDEGYIREMASRRGLPIIREKSHEILKEIIKKVNPKRILEIGTAVGYSGILMLDTIKDATLLTIEHDDYKVTEAIKNFNEFGMENRAEVINDDCVSYLSMLVAENKFIKEFDFVFLDGPKAQYIKMLESILMLTKSGGTILVDNVLFRGFVRGDKSQMPRRYKTIVKRLEMFLDAVEHHEDIKSYKLIDVEDGMLEIVVK